jgi:hypothetical protein
VNRCLDLVNGLEAESAQRNLRRVVGRELCSSEEWTHGFDAAFAVKNLQELPTLQG